MLAEHWQILKIKLTVDVTKYCPFYKAKLIVSPTRPRMKAVKNLLLVIVPKCIVQSTFET